MASAGSSIRRIERLNYGIGAIVIAVAALTQPPDIALGLAVGALLTCANFFVLRKLVVKWTREAATGRGGNAPLLMLPKMIGLMGAVALAIIFLPINVIAFTIGYSIFFASIVIEATYSALRTPDDPSGGAAPGSPRESPRTSPPSGGAAPGSPRESPRTSPPSGGAAPGSPRETARANPTSKPTNSDGHNHG